MSISKQEPATSAVRLILRCGLLPTALTLRAPLLLLLLASAGLSPKPKETAHQLHSSHEACA